LHSNQIEDSHQDSHPSNDDRSVNQEKSQRLQLRREKVTQQDNESGSDGERSSEDTHLTDTPTSWNQA